MRILCLLPLAALAACGGAAENKTKAAGATGPEPGQYEVTAEVTNFRQADEGTPKIDTPVGTRTTRSYCVPAGGVYPPDLFADEGLSCRQGSNSYVRDGMLNLTTVCSGRGLTGDLNYSVNGTFTGDSFQADRTLTTALSGDGDVRIASRIQGRRTGDCTPTPAGGNVAAPGNSN